MSTNSKIEWTDVTWNPVRGCTKVSPGCAHCYAETFAERFRGVKGHPYEQGFDLRLVPDKLTEPLSWKTPRRVFVNSMSDLFQDGVPFDYIDQVFAVMALAGLHTFQVLTKRADRMLEYFKKSTIWNALHYFVGPTISTHDQVEKWCKENGVRRAERERRIGVITNLGGFTLKWPLPNVWLGVSVENQHFADERIPLLLQTPAAIRFISAEPLLGPLDLYRYVTHIPAGGLNPEWDRNQLSWVIVGGESGNKARPFNVAWARSIVKQCAVAGVACFVKQLGANVRDRNDAGFEGDAPGAWPMDTNTVDLDRGYQGAPVRVLLKKKGGEPSTWPTDLQVRQFPQVPA